MALRSGQTVSAGELTLNFDHLLLYLSSFVSLTVFGVGVSQCL